MTDKNPREIKQQKARKNFILCTIFHLYRLGRSFGETSAGRGFKMKRTNCKLAFPNSNRKARGGQ
jgi:hypothetical protein